MRNCLIIVFCFSLTSCAVIFTSHQKVTVKSVTPESEIQFMDSDGERIKKQTSNGEGDIFKIKNTKDEYIITQSKEGYKSNSTTVFRERFNPIKFVDMSTPFIAAYFIMKANNAEGGGAILYGGLGAYIYSYYGSWMTYQKKFSLSGLIPLPQRDSSERQLLIKNVSINCPQDSINWIYYDSFKKYLKGEQLYKGKSDELVKIDGLIFDDYLNNRLGQFGYFNESRKIISNSYNSYKLNCEIVNVTMYSAGSIYFTEISSKWKLLDFASEKEVLSKYFKSTSNYTYYDIGNKGVVKSHIEDALDNSLVKFLNLLEVKDKLKSTESEFVNTSKGWDTLIIHSKDRFANNLKDNAKSTITIKTKDGYGSGCVITPDGYILTCNHVLSDNEDSIVVITENGSKHAAKLIRNNPIYDLALIKIDDFQFVPLKLKANHSIEVGTDVYAIGTPADIDLGQTISKGIISAKRKIDNRIYIQTDVSINKGNSGGALIDKEFNLLGIINAKIVGFGIEGIGFAIPVEQIEEALKIKIME